MRFYAAERLGPNQLLTNEGFLVCQNVPLARTGTQLYVRGETPIEVGPDGYARVERDEAEVFSPASLASFQGKPVTYWHPPDDVTPENWRDLAVGHVINPRRGDGVFRDMVVGDLFIDCPQAIKAIRRGEVRQVSNGYNADYEQTAPGRGRQFNILGNHVALVEEARCGARCSIGDAAPRPPQRPRRRGVHVHVYA